MSSMRPPRTLGPVHDPFWQYCAEGELRLPKCSECGHITWPPVPECECCHSDQQQWQPMSGRGKVVSWCTFDRDYYGGMLPMPWDNILVELDEGVLFLSNPEGFTNAEATVGMPVTVSFIDCEDRHGPFRLPVFKAES